MKLEKISNLIYSIGAAIVIFGAWAKIIHKPYADAMLTVGLLTEAALFVYMGASDWFKKSTQSAEQSTDKLIIAGSDNKELTSAVKELNGTINKIFKTA